MKILDFKFIILLALAIVIYFLYKEIESQRDRLIDCETHIKQLLEKTPLTLTNKEQTSQTQQTPQTSQTPQTLVPQTSQTPQNRPLTPQNTPQTPSTLNKKEQNNNVHLEIYSNDNDVNLETTVSDTLINKNNIDTSECSHTSSQCSDSECSESETSNKSESETSKKSSKSVPSKKSSKSVQSETSKKSSKSVPSKKSSKSVQSKNSVNELDDVLNDLKIELNFKEKNTSDGATFLKMKLLELQNLAVKENISLEKNINGLVKKKTKHELVEELLEKKNI
jgi:hypothetical protein